MQATSKFTIVRNFKKGGRRWLMTSIANVRLSLELCSGGNDLRVSPSSEKEKEEKVPLGVWIRLPQKSLLLTSLVDRSKRRRQRRRFYLRQTGDQMELKWIQKHFEGNKFRFIIFLLFLARILRLFYKRHFSDQRLNKIGDEKFWVAFTRSFVQFNSNIKTRHTF